MKFKGEGQKGESNPRKKVPRGGLEGASNPLGRTWPDYERKVTKKGFLGYISKRRKRLGGRGFGCQQRHLGK